MEKTALISVAGLIGVGKTTLAGKLAEILQARLILEEYDRNPFLARQTAGDPDAALPSELFFLMSRAAQLAPENIYADNTKPQDDSGHCPVVSDYIFQKNRIYAQISLNTHQFALYDEVERVVKPHITPPRTVIYLFDSVENCLERIAKRGRDFEKTITAQRLKRLSQAYEELFRDWRQCRLIRFDCSQADLRQTETVKQIVRQVI